MFFHDSKNNRGQSKAYACYFAIKFIYFCQITYLAHLMYIMYVKINDVQASQEQKDRQSMTCTKDSQTQREDSSGKVLLESQCLDLVRIGLEENGERAFHKEQQMYK